MKRASSDLQIRSFSDREIISAMGDLGGGTEVLASDLATRIFGLNGNDDEKVHRHAARCVTSRLSWMKRYGLVEKGDDKGTWWPRSGASSFATRRSGAPSPQRSRTRLKVRSWS